MAAKENYLIIKNRYAGNRETDVYSSAFEALGIFNSDETNTACGSVAAKVLLVLSGDMPGE